MFFILNELSLCGQYKTKDEFKADLEHIMKNRYKYKAFQQKLHCSRTLPYCMVTTNSTFRDTVLQDTLLRRPVLEWIDKRGPFLDDETESETWYLSDGTEVTNTALGQAGTLLLHGKDCSSLSFQNGGFDWTPITLFRDAAPSENHEIKNNWDLSQLEALAQSSIPTPKNWMQFLDTMEQSYSNLEFSPRCVDSALSQPFSDLLSSKISLLLRVLDEFVESLNPDGSHSKQSEEIIEKYFTGDRARFSDESDQNKKKFKNSMTFKALEAGNSDIFCPWHGKISYLTFRIHFEWPLREKRRLQVFYIGPKITKK